MVPRHRQAVLGTTPAVQGKEIFTMAKYRAFFKADVSGVGCAYELSESFMVTGMHNCRFLSFGVQRNALYHHATFVAIDPTRPIVLALSCNTSDVGFFQFSEHCKEQPKLGMSTYDEVRCSDFMVDCGVAKSDSSFLGEAFWSVRVAGELFVQTKTGDTKKFDTQSHWRVDIDQLCAFVAGAIDVRALRIGAYRMERIGSEVEKLTRDLLVATDELRRVKSEHESLVRWLVNLLGKISRAKFWKSATAARRFQAELLEEALKLPK